MKFCRKHSFSFRFLLPSPLPGSVAQSRSGCGQSCSESLADCILHFPLFRASLPASDRSRAGRACTTRGHPPQQGPGSLQPPPPPHAEEGSGQAVKDSNHFWHRFSNEKPEREGFSVQARSIFSSRQRRR